MLITQNPEVPLCANREQLLKSCANPAIQKRIFRNIDESSLPKDFLLHLKRWSRGQLELLPETFAQDVETVLQREDIHDNIYRYLATIIRKNRAWSHVLDEVSYENTQGSFVRSKFWYKPKKGEMHTWWLDSTIQHALKDNIDVTLTEKGIRNQFERKRKENAKQWNPQSEYTYHPLIIDTAWF